MARGPSNGQDHKRPAPKWRQKVVKAPEEETPEADTTVASEASGVGTAEVEAEIETTAEVEASTEPEAVDCDLDTSAGEAPAAQSQVPQLDFSNAAHLAFWLPLLSDQLVRSGYLTQCAVPPWSTSQASGQRRARRQRKAAPPEGNDNVGPGVLLQACWDHHSKGGCTRDTCRWQHFDLDGWQTGWLRLQRFCFGAQLATFNNLPELQAAVEEAFYDEARLAMNTPGNVFSALRSSLMGLKQLGYPFQVPAPPNGADGADGTGGGQVEVGRGRAGLLESVRALAALARPGCQVLPVGSFAWGIDIEGSDLDVVIATSGRAESDSEILAAICQKFQKLQARGKAPQGLEGAHCVVYGAGTSMPVLAIRTFQDGEPLYVDMCTVGNLSSVRDAILFRHYFVLLPRLAEVLQLLKRWLRLRSLPTSSEGGYPQIFWMRLAARTFQTVGGPSSEAAAQRPGDDADPEVRQLLRGFCAQWSQSLPSWGSLMNLVGEEPSPFLKRLPAGVYGATALLFLRELTILSSTSRPEDLPPVPPQQHLCPAKAGFWAAFLIPSERGLSDEASDDPCMGGSSPFAGTQARLVAGRVTACIGQQETVRCLYARQEDSSGRKRGGGSDETAQIQRYEFISRKDSDWVMLVDVNWKDVCDGVETRCKPMALQPQHFVCQLDGDPSTSSSAQASMRALQDLAETPAVKVGLPPPYPLYRYTRRVLLSTFEGRTRSKPVESPKVRVRASKRYGRKK